MRLKNSRWTMVMVGVIAFLMVGTMVWASPPAGAPSGPVTAGLNADTVDGLHASKYPNANTLLALNKRKKFRASVIPGAITRDKEVMTIVKKNDGAGSGLDADLLDGQHASDFWKIGGNAVGSTGILGTSNNYALEIRVNNARALRLEPNATSPNLIGGYSGNSVTSGVYGATIGGGGESGLTNRVTDDYATVGGGIANIASGGEATVGGGGGNTAGFGGHTTVGGGQFNTAGFGGHTTVGGGGWNTASDYMATVGGGQGNRASNSYATVAGGKANQASAEKATVGGGEENLASGWRGTVGGGYDNTASGAYAIVGGGYGNTASGSAATVGGGSGNTAAGNFSLAAGRRAKAEHQGAFVWGDSTDADIHSPANNTFIVRANGGIWFGAVATGPYTPTIGAGEFISTTTGAYLSTAGDWTNASDRNLKANLLLVDGQQVLERLSEVPITEWNYMAQDPSIRHMGPMAQDFYAAFGLGEDDKHISTVDADGVALAAIQGLYQLLQEKEAQIADLEARVAALEAGAVSPVRAGFLPGAWSGLSILLAGMALGWLTGRGKRGGL